MSQPTARLDQEFLAELLDGDREFAVELFDSYHESADNCMAEARRLLAAGDWQNAYRPFHTLKGASASVGLSDMRLLAQDLENRARAGELSHCQEALGRLERELEAAKRALKDYLEAL